ncbi:DUF927 domain-containing protein [Sphingobium sp. SJ10-10]|uniref:DUF927 domain-containing protein n=1 Tax=Sphingobium sp. SJ10-10 TaxID=3114999 RepID=UPI002E17017C|nr:DUF927 domain-containing protein [Sphingobium sp. SJ10-10]
MAKVATAMDMADMKDDAALADAINIGSKREANLPSGYYLKPDGLYFDGGEGPEKIAGPVRVVAQTRDRNSQAWGLLLRWRDDDGVEHQWSLPRSLMAGDGREVRSALLDGGLYVSPRTSHRNALQTFLASIRVEDRARAVTRVGWTDGAFALPDRTIGENGHLVVYQGTAALDHEYRVSGDLGQWQKSVAVYGVGNSRIAVALASAFVGPLLAAIGEEGGGVHFRGPSSIGKSTTLLAAASVWGPPSFVRQWRATQNGLEGLAEQANETLLILDELAQLDAKEAGSVAYLLANGTGKSRASQSGEAKAAKRWRAFFLSSGEISLSDHAKSDGRGRRSAAGQEVRILDIEADAGEGLGLFETLHGAASGEALSRIIKAGAAESYGIAGPSFVERLIGRLEVVAQGVRQGIDAFVAENMPKGGNGQVSRACRRFGLIAAAGETAARLGVLPWGEGVAIDAAKKVFSAWLVSRGGVGAAEDEAAADQVRTFLMAHGMSRFQPVHDDTSAPIYNRAGFWRADAMERREYLIPAATWKGEVCQGMDPKSVAQVLAARGFLGVDGAGKYSVPVTVPGIGKSRFYIVLPAIFGEE